MNKSPTSAQERSEQYKKNYGQPPQSNRPAKTLQLNDRNKKTEFRQHKSTTEWFHPPKGTKNDSLSAKFYNSNGESESKSKGTTKEIVTRISALSGLITEVTAIQNLTSGKAKEIKPMLVRLTTHVDNSSLIQSNKQKSSCPCCNGTGAFLRGRITRSCFRCDGKGYMDGADRRRYDAYLTSRGYVNKTTYKDHKNKYTTR